MCSNSIIQDTANTKTDIHDNSGNRQCLNLRIIGISVSILIIWNGVCDYIYGYSPDLSGLQYFSPKIWDVISTANNRPHWWVTIAQTAGWLYPVYALIYYHWWVGMKKAGFWLGTIPCIMLAYAILMIGGTQHTGWAFLSVMSQAKEVVGSNDSVFYALANKYLVEHFVMGDLTAIIAFNLGAIWHAIGILSGKTSYPRWFILLSPFGIFVATMAIGALLPAPFAGFVIALFGTWFMLIPTISSTVWLWNRAKYIKPTVL